MIIERFLVYFVLFTIVFTYPALKNKDKSGTVLKLLAIPATLGIIVTLFSIIKVYFIYKLLILLFGFVTFLLTYWQWGVRFRRWWR